MDKPWKVVAAFVGVFAFGGIFGGLLALRVFDHSQFPRRQPPTQQRAQGAVGGRPEILPMFTERLSLTPAQLDKIRPLVERVEKDLQGRRQAEFDEAGLVFARLHEEISSYLTPEQRVKLEKIKQRQKERLHDGPPGGGRFGGNGRRPGPPAENSGMAEPNGARPGK